MIRKIGAWTTRAGLLPGWEHLRDRAVAIGLTDVCLMLAASDDPHSRPFTAPEHTAEVCSAYRAAGIAPWLAVWARPSTAAMDAAADAVAAVASLVPIAGVHVDAEEPFLQGSTGHRAAAQQFAARMTALGLQWHVTGIVSTDMAEEGELVRLSSGGIVQAYSTRAAWLRWHVQPGLIQRHGYERWQAFGVPLSIGLAGYDQEGAGGLGAEAAMTRALAAVEQIGVETVWYWSLESIEGKAADVVRAAAQKARAA